MSSTVPRSTSRPWAASSAILAGSGSTARSGGLPALIRVVSTAFRSRVPVNSTLTPVWASNGLTMRLKVSSSWPPQIPRTVTAPRASDRWEPWPAEPLP